MDSIPGQGTHLGCRFTRQLGRVRRQHVDVCLSYRCFSLSNIDKNIYPRVRIFKSSLKRSTRGKRQTTFKKLIANFSQQQKWKPEDNELLSSVCGVKNYCRPRIPCLLFKNKGKSLSSDSGHCAVSAFQGLWQCCPKHFCTFSFYVMYIFISLGWTSSSGIAESYGKSVSNILGILRDCCQGSCSVLHSQQPWMRTPVSPRL